MSVDSEMKPICLTCLKPATLSEPDNGAAFCGQQCQAQLYNYANVGRGVLGNLFRRMGQVNPVLLLRILHHFRTAPYALAGELDETRDDVLLPLLQRLYNTNMHHEIEEAMNITQDDLQTMLVVYAVFFGFAHLLRRIIEVAPHFEFSFRDSYLLSKAAQRGHVAIVQLLLPLPLMDAHQALVNAIHAEHVEVVRVLLGDPALDPSFGQTNLPLLKACNLRNAQIVSLLLMDHRVRTGKACFIMEMVQLRAVGMLKLLLPVFGGGGWTYGELNFAARTTGDYATLELVRQWVPQQQQRRLKWWDRNQ